MSFKIKTALLEWAIKRSGKPREEILAKVPQLEEWLQGNNLPTTVGDLEPFAKATYTSVFLLVLDEPIDEPFPAVLGFRHSKKVNPTAQINQQPHSANLLDTIYDCQTKQNWYEDYCNRIGKRGYRPIGNYSIEQEAEDVAQELAAEFSFPEKGVSKKRVSKKRTSLAKYVELVERKGIMVVQTGIVKGDPDRLLSLDDCRGFALPSDIAPVVFINSNDSIEGMKFTLLYELAHIVINAQNGNPHRSAEAKLNNTFNNATDDWCNSFAAEILGSINAMNDARKVREADNEALDFFVSGMNRSGAKTQEMISRHINDASDDASIVARNSKLLCRALAESIEEGETLDNEAIRLLHTDNTQIINNL
ncbi:MAG: ImmA/IrrE family metallo-endopeptidase [Gammaproteobacteria bacterium]|nr:ImmA/IrrE family metallo-endopeptidase [Gammaproteobacteria bacterium]